MNIKTLISTSVVLFFFFNLIQAQSSSINVSGSTVFYESVPGSQISLKLKTPIKNKLLFTGAANLIQLNDEVKFKESFTDFQGNQMEIIYKNRTEFFIATVGVEYPAFSVGKINVNLNLGGGFMRDQVDYFGLLRGGLSLESRVSDKVSIGIPFNYSFITWKKDSMVSLGLNFGYHY